MQILINVLKRETESLKIQYLQMTEKWAKEEVIRNIYRRHRYAEQTSKLKDIIGINGYYQEQKFYYNTPSWYFIEDEFVERMLKNAEKHYENSIIKLAERINKKGLNQENITIKTTHIGINIDTIISDGNKIIKAFTIIASGDIQRPHYRYLIK